jgi:transcriptional regulator with XRE-family HTH domain
MKKLSSVFGAKLMNLTGLKVKQIREDKKLTQEQLTARCNLLGWDISRGTLAKIESRVRRVTDFEVRLLAKSLNIKEQILFD